MVYHVSMSVRLSEMPVVADLVLKGVLVESGGAALPHQANVRTRTRIYLLFFAADAHICYDRCSPTRNILDASFTIWYDHLPILRGALVLSNTDAGPDVRAWDTPDRYRARHLRRGRRLCSCDGGREHHRS